VATIKKYLPVTAFTLVEFMLVGISTPYFISSNQTEFVWLGILSLFAGASLAFIFLLRKRVKGV